MVANIDKLEHGWTFHWESCVISNCIKHWVKKLTKLVS